MYRLTLSLLFMGFVVISCNPTSRENSAESNSPATVEEASVQSEDTPDEDAFMRKVIQEFDQVYATCLYPENAVSILNGKKEFWNICEPRGTIQVLRIESHEGETWFQELYYSQNGALIYAKETQDYMPENSLTQQRWNCQIFMKDGQVFTYTSLGHGKTETDDWEPEEIVGMFEVRMGELDKLRESIEVD